MANRLRTAKSVGSWSDRDLKDFNISTVSTSSLPAFFGIQDLPLSPFANSVILNSMDKPNNEDDLSEDEADFFFYLSAVEHSIRPEDPTVGDLAAFLLRLCCFSSRDRFICQRPKL